MDAARPYKTVANHAHLFCLAARTRRTQGTCSIQGNLARQSNCGLLLALLPECSHLQVGRHAASESHWLDLACFLCQQLDHVFAVLSCCCGVLTYVGAPAAIIRVQFAKCARQASHRCRSRKSHGFLIARKQAPCKDFQTHVLRGASTDVMCSARAGVHCSQQLAHTQCYNSGSGVPTMQALLG